MRMTPKTALPLAALAALGAACAGPAAADTFTTLSDPLAAGSTFAQGINDSGQIVGFYFSGTDSRGLFLSQGFLYSGGVYTTLSDPLATGGTNAFGINNRGQIVGDYRDASGLHGFVYSGGTYTTVNDPLAPNYTETYGINNAGQMVGFYSTVLSKPSALSASGATPAASPLAGPAAYSGFVATPSAAAVPEPSAPALLALGLLPVGVIACKRRRTA